MIKAILFDLDGVLISTEWETFHFYQEYLKKKGIILKDEAFRYKAGRKSVDFFNSVLTEEDRKKFDYHKLILQKRDLFNKNIEKFVTKIQGGEALLQRLSKQGYLLALVSQNEKQMIDTAVDWLGVRDYFKAILSLEDIKNKKPNPEIYLNAAQRLSIAPQECLVIEDSKDGIDSAKNAGMLCVGVFHDYMPEGTLNNANCIIHRLSEINQDLINRLESRLQN